MSAALGLIGRGVSQNIILKKLVAIHW